MDWIWLKKTGKSKEEFMTFISSGKFFYEDDHDELMEATKYCGGFVNLPEEVKKAVLEYLKCLSEKESEVIRLYYKIKDESSITLDMIANKFNQSPERAKEIKEKALKRLKEKKDHPEENKNEDTEQH